MVRFQSYYVTGLAAIQVLACAAERAARWLAVPGLSAGAWKPGPIGMAGAAGFKRKRSSVAWAKLPALAFPGPVWDTAGMGLEIAVVGAGIGGLATALLAAADGHEVTLSERFEAPRPVGSGLVIQPVGLAVLDLLGAGAEARALASPILRMYGDAAGSGRRVLDVSYPQGAPGRAFHRASLFGLLWSRIAAAGVRVVTSACVAAAPLDRGRRHVALADGNRFGPFDLVVDASGAGSRLSPLAARPLRYGAIWGTVPWPEGTGFARDHLRQRYRRADRMVGVLPIGRLPGDPTPLAAIFWSMSADRLSRWPETPLDHWKAEAQALWPEIAPFLETITRNDQMTPARYAHGTLRRPFAPALAHIGDAAHRASPQLGQGANMALLDALALVLALRAPPEEALPAYAAMRRWHIRSYQGFSALLTPMYQSDSRFLPRIRDGLLAPLATWPVIRPMLSRLVAGDLLPPLAGERLP